jgi:bifunctional UDP-N-acetylglucosamine pyrophosphorylase / glucosamine-1-phosphate N-acetyltransferase
VRQKKNEELMAAGVTIVDPATTYVDPDVEVGADTVIHPNVYLEGQTRDRRRLRDPLGRPDRRFDIGDRVTINNYCVITGAELHQRPAVGPFAHLRPESRGRREGAQVGNFVELKKTVLGAGSKASHLSYLGDATSAPT